MIPGPRTPRSHRPLAAALIALAALGVALADDPRRSTSAAPLAPVGSDIAGGVEAAAGAWPWQVAILDAGNDDLVGAQFCGGVLIDPEWVLTAAKCIIVDDRDNDRYAHDTAVGLGLHDLATDRGQVIGVAQVIRNLGFVNPVPDDWFDIALLRLSQPAVLGEAVKTIPLVEALGDPVIAPGEMAMITGWGATEAGPTTVLREARVRIVASERCRGANASVVCAGATDRGACAGDTGGPLVVGGGAGGGWRLAGISSEGTTTLCGGSDRLTMYTSIPNSIAWIRETMAATGAALEIEKRAPEVIAPGATFTYAIEVRNVGLAPATEIKITEQVPSVVTFLSADQGGQLQDVFLHWTVASVAAGESATVHFTVRHNPAVTSSGPTGEHAVVPLALAGNRASGKGAGIDIVGGRLAEPGAWPWQAALLRRAVADPSEAQFCGGTLVAADWVLTAAHCVLGGGGTVPANTLDVQVGSNLLSDDRVQHIPVVAVVVNPLKTMNGAVDIALLKLARPATLSSAVQPIALAQPDDAPLFAAGMVGTVAGWGSNPGGEEPRIGLLEVEIPFVDLATCESRGDPDLTLCAGVPEGGKGPCYGDSGGPMVVRHPDGRVLQAGIVYRGTAGGCDGPGSYSLFTKVSAHVEWIAAQLGAGEPEEIIFNTLLNVYAAGSAGAGAAWPAKGHSVFTVVRSGGSAHIPTTTRTPTPTPTPTVSPTPDRPATATGTPDRPEPTSTAGDARAIYLPLLNRQVE